MTIKKTKLEQKKAALAAKKAKEEEEETEIKEEMTIEQKSHASRY